MTRIMKAIGLRVAVAAALGIAFARAGEDGRTTPGDLAGKNVGVVISTPNDVAAKQGIQGVRITYYPDFDSLLKALGHGSVDAAVHFEPILAAVVAADPSFVMMDTNLRDDDYGMAVSPGARDLGDEAEAAVDAMRKDGTLAVLRAKWVDGPDGGKRLPDLEAADDAEALRFGVAETGAPMVYADAEGKLTGLEIELARRIANTMGKRLELVVIPQADLLDAVADGRVDIAASALPVSRNRSQKVRFCDSYYRGGVTAMTKNR